MSKVDKYRIKEVLECLETVNKKFKEKEGIKKKGGLVYMDVRFKKNIEVYNEMTKIAAIGGITPVQLSIPHTLYNLNTSKILLFVRDGETR